MKGLIALMLVAVIFSVTHPIAAQNSSQAKGTFVLEIDDNLLGELKLRNGLKSYMPKDQTFSEVALKYIGNGTTRSTRAPSIFNPATEPAVNPSEPHALAFALDQNQIDALKLGKLLVSDLDPKQNIGMIKVVLDTKTTSVGSQIPAVNASNSTQFGGSGNVGNNGSGSIPSISSNADNVFGGSGNTSPTPLAPQTNQANGNGGVSNSNSQLGNNAFPNNSLPNAFPGTQPSNSTQGNNGLSGTQSVFNNQSGFSGAPPVNQQPRNANTLGGGNPALNGNNQQGFTDQNQVAANNQVMNSTNRRQLPNTTQNQFGGFNNGMNSNGNQGSFANPNHLQNVGSPMNNQNNVQSGAPPILGGTPGNGMVGNNQANGMGQGGFNGHQMQNQGNSIQPNWQNAPFQNQPGNNYLNRIASNTMPGNNGSQGNFGSNPNGQNFSGQRSSIDGPMANNNVQPNTPANNTSVSNQINPEKETAKKAGEDSKQPVASMSQPMLMVLWFMFFCSVGLNIYLFTIWKGAYSRYQDLADELRQTFSQTNS